MARIVAAKGNTTQAVPIVDKVCPPVRAGAPGLRPRSRCPCATTPIAVALALAQALELDPYYAYGLYTLAILNGPLDDPVNPQLHKASEAASLAYALNPDMAAVEAVVTCMLARNQSRLALELASDARRRSDGAPRALALLAQVYAKFDKMETKVGPADLARRRASSRLAGGPLAWPIASSNC